MATDSAQRSLWPRPKERRRIATKEHKDGMDENLRPGTISGEGFLGNDARTPADILKDDGAEVTRLGLTHKKIAARMQELRDAGARGLGDAVGIGPHIEAKVDSVRGHIPCPFGDGLFRKTNTTVKNLESGRKITYSDLNVHMIEAHGFYEGRGSPFRLEPAALAEVLGVCTYRPPGPRQQVSPQKTLRIRE